MAFVVGRSRERNVMDFVVFERGNMYLKGGINITYLLTYSMVQSPS